MFASLIGVFAILVFSSSYILYTTLRIQDVVNKSFEKQLHLKEIQEKLSEFQPPFLEYLSTRSSNALAELLVLNQRIAGMLPPESSGYPNLDESGLQEKEVYSLVSEYLVLSDQVIQEKRGMNVEEYTSRYEEMQVILGYIHARIESISSARLSAQLATYGVFIQNSRNIQLTNLVFIVSVSLFSFILLMYSVEKINRPMVSLSGAATEISTGNFEFPDLDRTRLYEIDHVIDAFNRMRRDIHTYIEEIKWQRNVEQEYLQERVRNMKMEQMLRRMELYTLQAQMNPHFLFNTLNTGIQLAIVEGAERTGEYMEHLSHLLRHNIREKDMIVPLRHEIEGLESYFYILRVRFPKNLDLVLDCPADLLDRYCVPASILQPLVENCVIHAFKGKEGRNSIVVRIFMDESRLLLSVSDNGIGMNAERVLALLQPLPVDETMPKVMGLENVIQRMYFYFPEDPDVVSIHTREGQGTEIVIRIDTEVTLCTPS